MIEQTQRTHATHQEMMLDHRELDNEELDDLLISLVGGDSNASSSAASPILPPAVPARHATRRPTVAVAAEELMEHDERGLPVAMDEETRKARKMARNRRAAAVSRERKKQRVDELEAQVARLEAENRQLKRKLELCSSGSETSETVDTASDVEWWPISQQPEAFWTLAPLKKVCTPPPFPRRLLDWLLTLCLSIKASRCSTSSNAARTAFEPLTTAVNDRLHLSLARRPMRRTTSPHACARGHRHVRHGVRPRRFSICAIRTPHARQRAYCGRWCGERAGVMRPRYLSVS